MSAVSELRVQAVAQPLVKLSKLPFSTRALLGIGAGVTLGVPVTVILGVIVIVPVGVGDGVPDASKLCKSILSTK